MDKKYDYVRVKGDNYNYFLPYIFILTIIIFLISVTAIILSGISFDQSKNRDTTVIELEWIEYDFIDYLDMPISNQLHIKFVTDNESVVTFDVSNWNYTCTNDTVFTSSVMVSNDTIPSYLIPKVNNTAIDSARFFISTLSNGNNYIGYFIIDSTGRFKIYVDYLDDSVRWAAGGDEPCGFSRFSGSYPLQVL
jgi:hypothetical protein